MDPLSVTTSVVTLLQLAAEVTTYFNDLRKATSEQKSLAIEISTVSSLLLTLRFRVEDAKADDAWFNQIKLLNIDNGPLEQFKIILKELEKQIRPSSRGDQIKSAVIWHWKKAEVEQALQKIERLKTFINLALVDDTFQLAQAIHEEVVQLQLDIKTHVSKDLKYRLSQWLQVPDPSSNYQAALAKRHSKSGHWFLTSSELQSWKASKASLLWLHGSAGSGKTVLSATALEHVFDEASRQTNAAVAYFYFDFNEDAKQRSREALRSLLFQLALQIPECLRSLQQAYQKRDDGCSPVQDANIQSILFDVLVKSSSYQTYVILDALDECADRSTLLQFIHTVAATSTRYSHLLVTSRREYDIEQKLETVADYVIDIQNDGADQDIVAYVRSQMNCDEKFKKWPSAIKHEIARELEMKANGMFRWVFCQLESLRACRRPSEIRKTLASLPKTLDETYARIFHQLKLEGDLSDAITVLQWLCFAIDPLRLSEIVDILAIENTDDGTFNPEERFPDPDDVMIACSSLITRHRTERAVELVQLAHFSVKEYLLSDRCSLRSEFDSQKCHNLIARGCLLYLLHVSGKNLHTRSTTRHYPLIDYAARNWWRHVQLARNLQDPITTRLIHQIFASDINMWTWINHCNPDGKDSLRCTDDMASPLYYASCVGLNETVALLLKNGADVNSKGGLYGTALCAASIKGHERVAQLLIDNGADVNLEGQKKDSSLGNALYDASLKGHKQIVQMLLDKGANVNAQVGRLGNALCAASFMNRKEVVQLLIDNGADMSAQGELYGDALSAATRKGHEQMVRLLIKNGANINEKAPYWRGNALQVAIDKQRKAIEQILRDHGGHL